MSTIVDSKVVEMRFDNKHFENNVQTSMSTLEKLKQKLNLSGATKGLENVNAAVKNINMTPLGSAVETVQAKFSALQVIGVTALANITNSAVNAGKRIVSALTIDPVKTGFSEYETQINAVQTILANTSSKGTTIDDVNRALEELNAYADKTIYNFTEMTRNIGTFTAAGVDLATSTNAIQGIANLAAISGSTSQQAATAMYQLSQALSSGTVKLMDWNSVVNAGMGGQVFQDALKETARVYGVDIDGMIETQGSFRETLSQGWLTAEILTDTLQKFTLTTEGLTDAQIESNREMLRAKGYTEDQIEEIFKLGRTATDAATKVKTFTQLWDVLKESAQSGWSQTWKLLVGDFEEAKGLFTPLADALTGLINRMSEWRNFIVQGAFDFKTIWDNIAKKLGWGGGAFTKISEAVKTATKNLEYFQEVVSNVWMGDFGNGAERVAKLTAAGYDYKVIQDLVNRGLDYQLTMEDVETSHKKFGLTMETTTESTKKAAKAVSELTDEELKNAGLTEDEIELFRALAKESERTGESISDLAKRMSENDGRTLLIDSFKNIGNALSGVATVAKEAWVEILDPPSKGDMIISIYNMIDALNKFTEKLRYTDEEGNVINESFEKIKRTFNGLFALIDIISMTLGGPLRIAFEVLKQVLSAFDLDILDVTANIGDAIVKFRDWLDSVFDISGVIEKIAPIIKNIIDAIKNLGTAIKESEFYEIASNIVSGLVNGLKNGASTVWQAVVDFAAGIVQSIKDFLGINSPSTKFIEIGENIVQGLVEGIKNFDWTKISAALWSVSSFFPKIGSLNIFAAAANLIGALGITINKTADKELGDTGGNIVSGIANGIWNGIIVAVEAIKGLAIAIVDAFKNMLGIHSPSVVFMGLGVFLVLGLILGLTKAAPVAWNFIKDFGIGLFNKLKETVTGIKWDSIGSFFSGIGKGISDGLKTLFKDFHWTDLSAILLGVGSFILGKKTLDTLAMFGKVAEGLGDVFSGLGSFIKNVGQGIEKNLKASALQKTATAVLLFAVAIGVLAGSIFLLTKIDVDSGKMWECYGMLAALMGLVLAMTLISSLISKIGGNGSGMKSALALVGMAAAIYLIAVALSKISDVSNGDLNAVYQTLIAIAAIVAAFTVISSVSGKHASKAGSMLLKISVALLIMVGVIKLMSKLDDTEIKKSLGVIKSLSIFIGALIAVSMLAGANASRAGSMLLKISVALLIMVGVFKLIGLLTDEEIKRGLSVVETLGTFAIVLVGVSVLAGKNAGKAGSMLLTMSIAIMAMVGAIALIGKLTDDEIRKGMDVVTTLGVFAVLLVAVSKLAGEHAQKAGSMLLTMSFALGILTGVIYLLTKIAANDSENMYKALGVVAVLELLFIGLLAASKNASGAMGALIVMALTIAILSGVLIALALIPQEGLPTAISCLTGLVGVFALLIACSKFAPGFKQCIGTFGSALIVVAGLTVLLYGLSKIEPGNAMANVKAISVLLLAFSASVLIMSHMKGVEKAFGVLMSMVLVTALLAVVLWGLDELEVESSIETVASLSILLLAFSAATLILSKVGTAGGAAINGALSMVGVVAILAAFAMVVGGLMSLIPQDKLSKWKIGLAEFMDFIVILCAGLGEAIGAFVGGLVTGVLVGIAESLSDFMTSIQGFLDGLANVDSKSVAGAAAIAEILLILVGVEVLNKLADLIPGEEDLSGFGSKLVSFGRAMVEFSDTIAGKIDTQAVTAAANAGSLMAALAKELPNTEGLWGWIAGKEDLEGFGNKLVPFGRAMVKFSETVAGKIDVGAVGAAAAAGEIMVALAKDMPNTEGLLGWITGKDDLEGFGNKLVPFGRAMVRFSSIVAGNIDQSAFTSAKSAADIMVALAKEMPNTEGLLGWITGKTDLDEFGDQLVPFGKAIVRFSSTVAGNIDQGAVESAKAAGDVMVALANSLPDDGNWWTNLFGGSQDTLDSFGKKIVKFGESMVAFSDVISGGIDVSAVSSVTTAAKTIADMGVMLSTKEADLSSLNDSLKELGESMVNFSETISSIDNIKDISTISFVGLRLAQMADIMPEEVDLARVTTGLSTFGEALVDFSESIGEDFDTTTIDTATQAGQKIVNMIASMPPDLDVLTLAAGIGRIGGALSTFATNVVDLDTATIENATAAGEKISSFVETIPDYIEMGDFVAYVPKLGSAINSFALNTAKIDSAAVSDAATAGSYINTFLSGIPDYIDMADFLNYVPKVGNAIRNFGINTEGVDSLAISEVTSAGSAINTFLEGIPQYTDIESFVTNAARAGGTIKLFGLNAAGLSYDAVANAVESGKKINAFLSTIPQYLNIADFVDTLPKASGAIKTFASDLSGLTMPDLSAITTELDKLADSTITSFINGLVKSNPRAATAGSGLIKALGSGITGSMSVIVTCVEYMMNRVIASITSYSKRAKTAGETIANSAVSGLSGLYSKGKGSGEDLGAGLVQGIISKTKAVYNAGYNLGQAAVRGEKDGQQSQSPSKLTILAGKWLGEGLVIGMSNMTRSVYSAGYNLGDTATNSISNTISKIADMVNTDLDVNPTIRPVLDLSDVEANAGLINAMIGSGSLVGVSANVGAISSMINSRSQNGANDNVVSEIRKLRKGLDNVGNNVTNINGITYDDGSNVSGAVKALVREVKIQRRV